MKHVVSILLILGSSGLIAKGQQPQQHQPCMTKDYSHLIQAKPQLYITFESMEKKTENPRLDGGDRPRTPGAARKTENTQETGELVWLRLHNNTRWAIILNAGGWGDPEISRDRLSDGRAIESYVDGTQANIYYQPEASPTPVIRYNQDSVNKSPESPIAPHIYWSDQIADRWLMSGRSVVFPVRREYLVKGLKIYITYNYEWETKSVRKPLDEPQHRVYFDSQNLP